MNAQCASDLLMIRPCFFRSNPETIATNAFQESKHKNKKEIELNAIKEFDIAINQLQRNGININVINNANPETPDAVFSNNWISFHHDGTVILYPMMALNLRTERKKSIVDQLSKKYDIRKIIDLTHHEKESHFLEGTGSLVFDHQHKIAYAALSPRTHPQVIYELCTRINYKPFIFSACDTNGISIYHTNVLLNIGNTYAVVCFEAITDQKERTDLRRMLSFTGHEVTEITLKQLKLFAGNMLQVVNNKGKYFTILSAKAIRSLHLPQINIIAKKSELLSIDVNTFEYAGGGSIRCIMTEIFCNVNS